MGEISDVEDIMHAIVYLAEACHVTAEVLHVDAGARNGKWQERRSCTSDLVYGVAGAPAELELILEAVNS